MESVVKMNNFYKDKKVLVTGHTGFKGSWLVAWLKYLGANVTGYSLEPHTNPTMYELCNIQNGIKSVIGDIRDKSKLEKAMVEAQPDIVFHLAAQALVPYSYEYPVETFETNIMGTVNVLESIRNVKSVKSVVLITTDKCYKNQESFWGYRENDPLGGFDPYSSSKACAELVIDSYRNSYFNAENYEMHGVGIASARAGNVIGGGDFSDNRLIPDIISAILEEKDITLRNPNAIRPWQHVLEPLSGYLDLGKRLYTEGNIYNEAWNFGPTDAKTYTVEDMTKKMIESWGKSSKIELEENPIHETNYLKLDVYKASHLLDYASKLSMDKTLEWIVDWYKQYEIDKTHLEKITLDQIRQYNELIMESK